MSLRVKFDFIPFPLAIVDEAIELSLGEYRLLGYLLRHRFRVKSEQMLMTQDDLLRGVLAPDGSRRDKGCGITSGRDLKAAREKLEQRGWLKVHVIPSGTIFELCLLEDEEEAAKPASANCTGEVKADQDASAKCTGTEEDPASANCPDPQCKMSILPVQNALDVIRKEKVKKGEEDLTPKSPLAPLAEGDSPNPRWRDLREDITAYWKFKNPDVPQPWAGARDGKALQAFLLDNPLLTRPMWQRCLRNRARSEVPHALPPHRWLHDLLKYSECAFDGYGKKIVTGRGRKHDDAEQLIDANRAGGEDWLRQRRQGRSLEPVSGRVRGHLEPPDPQRSP